MLDVGDRRKIWGLGSVAGQEWNKIVGRKGQNERVEFLNSLI